MTSILSDLLNLKLLKLLSSGKGVDVNISQLSEIHGKHRNTIKNKVDKLFEHKIVDKPFYPFLQLFQEHPLLVIEKCDFPRDSETNRFIEKDPYIWFSFTKKDEEYNTLLLMLHKDLYTYQNWREDTDDMDRGCIIGECRNPSEAILLSTKNFIKYDPASSISIVEKNYREKRHLTLNGLNIDDVSFQILKTLLAGKCIKTNESLLANELNVHRRTIQKRIESFVDKKILSPPLCRFPRVWIPPGYIMVISLVEIKKNKESVLKAFKEDPHNPLIVKTCTGRYNLVLFSNFWKVEDHLHWAESLDQRFAGSIGAVKNTYLSPKMSHSIAQEYISWVFLENRFKRETSKALIKVLRS